MKKVRKHVLITGTGRAGTSFLVELLTHLGLETGYRVDDLDANRRAIANAGFENDIRHENCPYIVKAPQFCEYADEVMNDESIDIEHIFIPIRDLHGAAESRRQVTRKTRASLPLHRRIKQIIKPTLIPGGLIHTESKSAGAQEQILTKLIYDLMLALSETKTPITLIRYPRHVKDPEYLYQRFSPILKGISYDAFHEAYLKLANPDLVSSFSEKDV